jgi:carboxyl-terminal processing protease
MSTIVNKRFVWIVGLILAISFSSCRQKDEEPYEDIVANQIKEKIVEVMQEWYLWNNTLPQNINPRAYATYQDLVDALRTRPIDRWSFVMSKKEYDDLVSQGIFAGHGYIQLLDPDGNLRVAAVYKNSPAFDAGFKRSAKILSINGKSVSSLISSNSLTQELGPRQVGVVNSFRLQFEDGTIKDVSMPKAVVQQNTVLYTKVFDTPEAKIGYLVFMSFNEPSIAELAHAFQDFKAQGVNQIILDLRYNGGGFLSVAQYLANAIAPNSARGQILTKLTFNSGKADRNDAYRIGNSDLPFNLNRLVVISTQSTASASELIINGLKPFMDLKVVGDRSYGKPVGSVGFTIGDQILNPISFIFLNANNEGEFYNGIAPDQFAADGLNKDWGDPEEPSLREALHYIRYGSFSPMASARFFHPYREINKQMLQGFQQEIGAF